MNILLWVFLTLQINFPLFNINSQQVPGYDYQGGPRHRIIITHPVTMPKVASIAKYYTCPSGVWFGKNPCKFHNEAYVTQCLFTVSYGHNIPCTAWKGFLL